MLIYFSEIHQRCVHGRVSAVGRKRVFGGCKCRPISADLI